LFSRMSSDVFGVRSDRPDLSGLKFLRMHWSGSTS
jgi:hypothetical protein